MTSTPPPASGTPSELLATAQELTRRVRRIQRSTWFPLLTLALVTLIETPFDRFGHRAVLACTHDSLGGSACSFYRPWSFFYWPVALVVAYITIAAFYIRRSRRLGVGTRVRPYVAAGSALALLLTALALWANHDPGWSTQSIILENFADYQLVVPLAAIGTALLVLVVVERSWALLGFAVVYVVTGFASAHYIRTRFQSSPWAFLPHVLIPAGALLLGCLGFWFAQRRSLTGVPRSVEAHAE